MRAEPLESHTPVKSDGPAPLRGLAIRTKLFLLIGTLIAVVTASLSGAAYSEMKSAALAATAARLDGIAMQWARMFESSVARQLTAMRAVGDAGAVRRLLSRADPAARAAAAPLLRSLFPAGQGSGVQLVNASSVPILSLGDSAALTAAADAGESIDRAGVSDSGGVGKLRARGQVIYSTMAVRVPASGPVQGYLIQTSRLRLNPSPEVLNRLFGGEATQIRLANSDGSLWTDLEKPIPAPDVDLSRSGALTSYTSASAGPVFAAVRQVAGAPYSVVLETSQNQVLALPHRFRARVLELSAIAIALGLLVAALISNSLTKPLASLTQTAEAVAAGDYSRHTGLAPRGDEVGRLANAFDSMVSDVQAAFASKRVAERSYRVLFNSLPLPCWVIDLETLRIVAVNDRAVEQYGYSREEFHSLTVTELRPPEDVPRMRDAIQRIDGTPDHGSEWRHRKKDGTVIDVETHAHSITFQAKPARIVVVHNITERKRARDVIRRLDERYRRLVQDSPEGITLTSLDGRVLAVNPAFVRMLGYESEAEVMALDARALYPSSTDRAALMQSVVDAGQVHRQEVHLRRKDGSAITVLLTDRFVTDPDTGEQYFEAVTEDVTDIRRLERQYHQAQKMEAVGQLAGGVAHDFNNLLTVILSYSDFLLSELPPDAALHRENVEAIRDAGVSAASLTRQLLVFSRQQVVEPKVMRLNDVLDATGKLLTRFLGEHVELTMLLDPDTGAVKVDAGQMEQVIVNLAVNARDAMPDGGRLLIESRNVDFAAASSDREMVYPAGPHIMLSVSDNGTGMDAATQARLFEPFFTTKAPGKGTGLGLATVYGIVKQSGGEISVYSEPGSGTSFKMFFPRFDHALAVPEQLAAAGAAPGCAETVLIVEDQPAVRTIVRQVLERGGYQVLEATDAEGALEIASKHAEPIRLLLTDVIMPRMSGRELADQFAKLRPDARILFISGYTDDAIVHHGVLEREMQFLQKPFTSDALLRKVREVLDAAR